MKNELLGFLILFALLSCGSEPEETLSTPLAERNLEFEIYDSLVVDYLGNVILMDISPDGSHYLLMDQNNDSILVANPNGDILYRYNNAGEGPEDYMNNRSGLAKFISNEAYLLPTPQELYHYSLEGDLIEKFDLGFSPNVTLIVSNSDNLTLRGNKVFTNMSGRYLDEGKVGAEYQKIARKIEILDMETGEFAPALPFPQESRFSSETESHPSLAYYTNLSSLADSIFISFRNEPKLFSYHISNLDSPAFVRDIPFETFILAQTVDDESGNAFRLRDLFVGTINSVIPIENGVFMIDYLSGLTDEEIDPILSELGGDFAGIFQEANRLNTAGRVLFDGHSISSPIENHNS